MSMGENLSLQNLLEERIRERKRPTKKHPRIQEFDKNYKAVQNSR